MKTYILKRDFPPMEPYLKVLQDLVDYSLRIDGEMVKALEARQQQPPMEGRHGQVEERE